MGANVRVVDQKFYAKLNNGNDFTENLTDFSQHLKGGVLEEIKAVFNIQVGWYSEISGGSSSNYVDTSANTMILRVDGKDFSNDGFSVGDSIKISDDNWKVLGDIKALSIGEVFIENTVVTGAKSKNAWGFPSNDIWITGTTPKTALKYDFGLIENLEPINFLSKLTNENQTYLFEGINQGTPNVFVDGKSFGNNKAGYTGSAKVAFVGYSIDFDPINTENTTQEFQIEHTFKIAPFYRDGELDSLKGLDKPPLDIFNGDASLKYVFQTEFRTVLSNPNTSMISSYDTQLGSVGYLDESYNGYESNYSVSNLVYTVGGLPVDRLEIGSVTNVSFNIDAPQSTFSPTTPLIVGHTAIVDSLDYSFNSKNYSEVWTDEILRLVSGGGNFQGTSIKNASVSYIGTAQLSVSFDIEFSADQIAVLEDKQDYTLYYTVQNPTLDVDNGDKITGRIDVNYYDKNSDVAGLFDFETFTQYPHPLDINEVGFTSAKTFNESGMMAKGRFWVLNDANLNDLKFDIAVYKTDDTWDSLRSLVIDLSEQTTVNGIQQIELDTTRGYILAENDIFNYLKVTTDTNNGTKQYYDIEVGYRIPWQSWLKFDDAPAEFYDKTKSNNGLNQKASNYSMVINRLSDNVFTDVDNGTFESQTTTGLTSLIYSAGTPNQIGNGLGINTFGYNSSYSGVISFSAPVMTETNKNYKIFTNDTPLSVIQGKTYQIESYISMVSGQFDPLHIDNGSFYWLPDGNYDVSECTVTPFEIITSNLYDGNPANRIWVKVSTSFVAKTTESLTAIMYEAIQVDIPTNTGGQFDTDTITFKEGNVDYSIKTLFDAVVDETRYVTTSEEIEVYDYDEDDQEPDAFTCEIQTFKKDDLGEVVPIGSNVIQDGYTQLRAIFTPLVPPVFTEDVDMTEVATEWFRFAHGNYCDDQPSVNVRLNGGLIGGSWLVPAEKSVYVDGTWANDQSGYVNEIGDTMVGLNWEIFDKDQVDLYTSTASTITTNSNIGALYGCFSKEYYENYQIKGEMFSSNVDNDSLAYNICFNVDEFGVERTLSLVATTGGMLLDISPTPTVNTFQYNPPAPNNDVHWALVYNYGKSDCKQLDIFHTLEPLRGWSTVNPFFFEIKRSENNIDVICSWDLPTVGAVANTFSYNLETNVETEIFKGLQQIGFSFASQNEGGFQNVQLTAPSEQFYSEIRIEPKESQSDFTDSRISSYISAPSNGILTEIAPNENKATLEFDPINEFFVVKCLIDTSQVKAGGEYDFSAELRPLNLEA